MIRSISITEDDSDFYWNIVQDEDSQPNHILRSASILAVVDSKNKNWNDLEAKLTNIIFDQDEDQATKWLGLLSPILPAFENKFQSLYDVKDSSKTKSLAAKALADIHGSTPARLIKFLEECAPEHFELFFEKLENSETVDKQLQTLITGRSSQESKTFSDLVNLVICRIRMGKLPVIQALNEIDNAAYQTHLIIRLGKCKTDIIRVADALALTTDERTQRLLLCALGFYSDQDSQFRFQKGSNVQLDDFLESSNAGLRSAADWVSRKWGTSSAIDRSEHRLTNALSSGQDWYYSSSGHLMIVIGDKLDYRSPIRKRRSEDPEPRILLPYRFKAYAIGAHEVTRQQFEAFASDVPKLKETGQFFMPKQIFRHDKSLGPDTTSPINFVSYDLAASYCNWLSLKEGIPETDWCYKLEDRSMILVDDFRSRTGYRLPTEFEWENASGREFELLGDDEVARELANLAYGTKTTTLPIGSLMPNERGLFDCYGNVYEWCTRDDDTKIKTQTHRGSSCIIDAELARDPVRDLSSTSWAMRSYGFRVLRMFNFKENK